MLSKGVFPRGMSSPDGRIQALKTMRYRKFFVLYPSCANILYDEKIGGTVHMAIGQTYYQCGGKNQSSIHWDMIADMKNGGEIWANDDKIYDSGKFLFL